MPGTELQESAETAPHGAPTFATSPSAAQARPTVKSGHISGLGRGLRLQTGRLRADPVPDRCGDRKVGAVIPAMVYSCGR
jgi:hypothetical protein